MPYHKKKILHVVYAMNTGGIESWLMNLYRCINRDNIQFDFLVNIRGPAFFDEEIIKLGGRIIYGGKLNNPVDVFLKARAVLQETQYEAVHCHNVENAFPILFAAKINGLSNRLYHCHNNVNKKWRYISPLKKTYLKISNQLSIRFSTKLISVSKESGDILFGKNEYQQIYLGLEVKKFEDENRIPLKRRDFGLKDSTLIIGHVGRFDPQKNHDFFVKIARDIVNSNPDTKFILIGTGKLEFDIIRKIKSLGLEDNFLLLGTRSDIPQLMIDIMDVFLFPSLFEGLGLVIVEAQAAGLPVVCSNMVPNEAIVNRALVDVCELDSLEKDWVDSVLKQSRKNINKKDALQVVSYSNFNLEKTISILESLWLEKR